MSIRRTHRGGCGQRPRRFAQALIAFFEDIRAILRQTRGRAYAAKSYALRSQLTWTHWRLIMRVETAAAREYYIHEAAEQGWSSRQLERRHILRSSDVEGDMQ